MGSHEMISLCAWIATFVGFGFSIPTGTEFITTFMQNSVPELSQKRYELKITAHSDNTEIVITNQGATYNIKISLNSGKTTLVSLSPTVEIRGSLTFNNAVIIKSNEPINILSLNHKFQSAETSVVYPVTSLGTDYYLVTPIDTTPGNLKVFSVLAYKDATSVQLHLKGRVQFAGYWYNANSILTVDLAAYEGVQLLSSDDLSGTRVISEKPVAVLSGHTGSTKSSLCNHVYEQLLPVSHWGTNFIIPTMSFPSIGNKLSIIAAGITQVTYTLGTRKQTFSLVPSQILNIELPKSPLIIKATAGVQVTLFNSGGRLRRSIYKSLFMNVLDIKSYCSSYYIYGQKDIDNYAIVIAQNSAAEEIKFDGRPLQNAQWKKIQGTEYSLLEHYIGNTFTTHTFEHPNSPFGLQSVGLGSLFSYGSPAIGIKDPSLPPPSCDTKICPRRHICVMENEKPNCVQQQIGLCSATGDPHYRTFDGKYYDFMGTCTYTMAWTCGDVKTDLPDFKVLAKNENRGNLKVSWLGQVTFQTGDYIIDIKKSEVGYIRVNNAKSQLPVTLMNGILNMFQSGRSLIIHFGKDVQVSYDWNHVLRIELPRRYAGQMCGMCGNYNQDPADDFQTPDGSQAPGVIAFGKSWKVNDNSVCWDDCHGPCQSCPPNMAQQYATDDYCGLLGKITGPFSACHATLDPKMYMENCVFDVCFYEGSKKFLCDTLKDYADTCQREGVNINQWREAAGCPLNCPGNSAYKQCGRACPATCQDPEAKSICPEPCVETCECDPGFVLIKGQCLPYENCGCLYEGQYYAPNEIFWGDSKCNQKCVCNAQTQKVKCKDSGCRDGEECILKDGLLGCHATSYSRCYASGDPHYISFDGLRYSLDGNCQYQLSALCEKKNDLINFQVNVWNQNRGTTGISYTTAVDVKVYGKEILINRHYPNKVMVDGLLVNLPYSCADGRLSLFQNPNSAVISADFGLTVTFDWSSIVIVTIPDTYAGALCGLCGNCNRIRNDDIILRDEATQVSTFDSKRNISECKDLSINPICHGLAVQEERQRDTFTECGILLEPQGPFCDCHKFVDPEDYFKNCAHAYCNLKRHQTFFCPELSSYAQACQAAGGTVHAWRSKEFCSYSCPSHSHYELCAEGCPVTCNGFTSPTGCDSSCKEGCVCDEGFILSGGSCVRLSECGCVDDNGVYYAVGEGYYVGEVCTERCTCSENGRLTCSPTSCSINEECRIENGVRGCFPVGSATCTVSGYSHFKTFDGRAFGHQGVCSYILSQSCGDSAPGTGRNLTEFRVTIENKNLGSSEFKFVTVEMYGQVFTLKQKSRGIIEVNGAVFSLPITLLSGKLRAESFGLGTLIVSEFGLKVTYDLSNFVTVTVPSTYKSRTCGMCGNFNDILDDDVGPTSSDVITFGEKWKIPYDGKSCESDCGNTDKPCATCDGPIKNIFSQENYCGILSATTGPFAKCNSKMDPEPYQNDCIFDLCQSKGNSAMLCNIAVAYAAACKEAGVPDFQWRSDSFCGIQCPPHSHYTTCTDLCSSSCAALTDPYDCGTECAEGCQCDDGYLFDGTQCVPFQECGCFENGHYYQPHQVLFDDDCSQACTCIPYVGMSCNNTSCAEDETCEILDGVRSCINADSCISKKCYSMETCQIQDGNAACVPNYMGTCWVWGDTHFQSFDGYSFDFQGTCSYILAAYTGDDKRLVPFHIEVKKTTGVTHAVSLIRVTIVVYNKKITLQTREPGKIRVNGVLTNLPVTLLDGAIRLNRMGFRAILETDFGLAVSFDLEYHALITIPSSYYDKVSGLCGNFNQNPNDDQRSRNNTQISSITEWAGSWKVYDQETFCFDDCPGDCPTCEESKKSQYGGDQYCGLILKHNGPFRKCHPTVKPNNFFDNCLHDVCINEDTKNIHCNVLESYATTCLNKEVTVYDWRTLSGCRKECYENSHYVACGSACQATCVDRNAPSQCAKPCVETCECNDGFVFSVDKCVPISSCGCQYNGQYYQPNQEFWSNNRCKSYCKCEPSLGMVVCRQTSCKAHEECRVVNGKVGCHPDKYSTCIATGDPHYSTFDGKKFDFMGTCIYLLSGVKNSDSSLTHFSVHVKNDNRGNKAVSFTRDVTFIVYNQTITMSKEYPQKIKVNGLITELPYYYQVSKIIAFIKGVHVFIKTDFDVTVTFDGNSYARVILPSTYTGAVNGLCGNNNQDPSDDFTLQNGQTAQNSVEFGDNWKVEDVPGCSKECPDCPTCSTAEMGQYNGDQFCGLLTKADGPFSQCFLSIDPTPYFEDCVFDACQYRGQQSAVCNNIAAYVLECQNQGMNVKEWRTRSFCPLTCPKNSHYEFCGNGCPTTCYDLTAPAPCEASCTEGCYCDRGFVLSGKNCVPISQCGCISEDKYYKEGEEFYTDNQCQQMCKCGNNGVITCQSTTCKVNEECKVVHGKQGCHSRKLGTCAALGDGHYVTFDDLVYDFKGTCKYTLFKVNSDNTSFSVEAEHESTKGKISITVYINGNIFYLDWENSWSMLVNNKRYHLPFQSNDGQVWVNKEGNNVILQSTIGLKVLYDGLYYVSVWVPNTFSGITQGLCGNFNKDKSDDLHLPNGTIIMDPAKFGDFWAVVGDGTDCHECIEGTCPVCDPREEAKARVPNSCGMIADLQGPFKDCHALVPPEQHVTNCAYDVCTGQRGREALCVSMQAYAIECQNAGGILGDWRKISKCPISCPLNSHYELCTRTCDFTCAAIFSPSACTEGCFEGCECDSGYVFDGDKCVRIDHCGCIYNGQYLQADESVVSEGCSQRCTCTSGIVFCEEISCATDEKCQLKDEQYGCHPPEAECSISADYEFKTFDGISGAFNSQGSYVLASSCNVQFDRQFLVAVNILQCSNYKQGRSLHVFTSQGLITMNAKWEFWLNGRDLKVPSNLKNGSIRVSVTQSHATIEIVDQITVVVGIEGDVKLIANDKIAGTTCGACGNFNGEGSDDLRLKNGEPANTIVDAIHSWTARYMSTCN